MKIDITKKYRTRDGQEVTHLHLVPEGWPTTYPVRGLLDGKENEWTERGSFLPNGETKKDLIEVREPREWVIRGHSLGGGNVVHSGPDIERGEMVRVREIID